MDWAVETKGAKRFNAETQRWYEHSESLMESLLGVEECKGRLGFREEGGDSARVVECVRVVG